VQDNLPLYVFSIDIPFKGSQNLKFKGSKSQRCHICTAVSQHCQWHRCAVCSRVRFPYGKTVCQIIREDIRKKLFAQRCQWHRCDMQSGFIDTAVPVTVVSMTLCRLSSRIRSHIRKALTCVSGTQGKLFDEKNRGRKSRVWVPLKKLQRM
jgi:hypothetical protein